MSKKVQIIDFKRDDGIERSVKLEIKFVYSCEENSINGIIEELEEVIKKYSL